jgi:hypothetical protein
MPDETPEPKLRVLRVCVLTVEAFGGNNSETSIHRTYADAKAELDSWCRDIWDTVQEDWELGERPDDDAQMYETFRNAAQDHDDVQWRIYQDVPLNLALTIVPAEAFVPDAAERHNGDPG